VSNPLDLGLLGAAEVLRSGGLSPLELLDACLQRIEERNGGPPSFGGGPEQVNAWVRLYPELAREQAIAAEARLQREGEDAPLLCGVPLALKDLYGVAGLPLTASSRVLDGNVAEHDSAVWSRLRDQGMVLLGHTHTHEFAAGGTTDQVGNPWALDRVVGGSSGGNAAALATGMAPAAVGTDTCGSLRIPSACCGTSAIKPTHGRLPLDGVIPLARSLDHPGPMARSVADCSALLEAMVGAGGGARPEPLPRAARPRPKPLDAIKIAVSDRPAEMEVEEPVAAALERALKACESIGAELIQTPTPAKLDWEDVGLILLSEMWAYHAQFSERSARYRPAIAELVEVASAFTDAQRYIQATWRRARLIATFHRWLEEHGIDLVIEPTLPITPLARGPGYERGHAGGPGDPMIALTALWDMTGMPVVSLPVEWNAGVSLIAARGREAVAIQAAIDLQEHALGIPRLHQRWSSGATSTSVSERAAGAGDERAPANDRARPRSV
jgi:aspartyl-tRNA(Asn)/glutamyl-tRNA(Gln) amidotransferase subunit A